MKDPSAVAGKPAMTVLEWEGRVWRGVFVVSALSGRADE
jgi:hypothetical protein